MFSRQVFAVLLVAATVLPGSEPSLGTSELKYNLFTVAKQIAQTLKDEKQTTVAVQPFTGPKDTSAGPMIQTILLAELKKQKVRIDEKAFVFLGGEYYILESASSLSSWNATASR
jgi:hypothetical protein